MGALGSPWRVKAIGGVAFGLSSTLWVTSTSPAASGMVGHPDMKRRQYRYQRAAAIRREGGKRVNPLSPFQYPTRPSHARGHTYHRASRFFP